MHLYSNKDDTCTCYLLTHENTKIFAFKSDSLIIFKVIFAIDILESCWKAVY